MLIIDPLLSSVKALKWLRNESFEDIGKSSGVNRSNLSSYIASNGQSKALSFEKLQAVLSHQGMGIDRVLLPTLHIWKPAAKGLDANGVNAINDLLSINKFTCFYYHPQDNQRTYLVGVSHFGSRLIIVLPYNEFFNRNTICSLIPSTLSAHSSTLDAEFNQLIYYPSNDLFDQIFYWVSQCVVDDVFKNNEVQTCS